MRRTSVERACDDNGNIYVLAVMSAVISARLCCSFLAADLQLLVTSCGFHSTSAGLQSGDRRLFSINLLHRDLLREDGDQNDARNSGVPVYDHQHRYRYFVCHKHTLRVPERWLHSLLHTSLAASRLTKSIKTFFHRPRPASLCCDQLELTSSSTSMILLLDGYSVFDRLSDRNLCCRRCKRCPKIAREWLCNSLWTVWGRHLCWRQRQP